MKLLFVNKFLYPKGGCEIYMLKLGAYLQSIVHEVRYFEPVEKVSVSINP